MYILFHVFSGAAAALVIASYFQPAIIIIYVKARKLHKKTWGGMFIGRADYITKSFIQLYHSLYTVLGTIIQYSYYLGWSWESLEEWGQFLKLGIPGTIMLALEWVSFEISAFVLGSINEVELAINGILINYLTFIFMVSKKLWYCFYSFFLLYIDSFWYIYCSFSTCWE